MKKNKFAVLLALILLSLIFVPLNFGVKNARAFTPLDEILNYEITVETLDDATLNLTYHIEWKVLDSTKEGPLSWVKIGVPNRFVDNIKYLGSNCRSIEYTSDDGAFIEIEFKREYTKNEIVNIDFSYHAYRMFTMQDDDVTFQFIPGWFEEIKVDNIKVKWPKKDVLYTQNNGVIDGDYIVYQTNLDYNERLVIDVAYDKNVFPNRNEKMQYSSSTVDPWSIIIPIAIIVLIVVVIFVIAGVSEYNATGGYYSYRGYSGTSYYHWWYHGGVDRHGRNVAYNPTPPASYKGGSGGSGFSSSCACACACACAGGGRAGCSRKDFVNNLNEKELEKYLND